MGINKSKFALYKAAADYGKDFQNLKPLEILEWVIHNLKKDLEIVFLRLFSILSHYIKSKMHKISNIYLIVNKKK